MKLNTRTLVLAIAAVGLLAGSFTAPAAGADTTVPDDYPGECKQVYFFVFDVGPVTVDASDSCWQVIVHSSEDCDPADVDDGELDADCKDDAEAFLQSPCDERIAGYGINCDVIADTCDKFRTLCYCTCDPIRPGPAGV